MDQEESKICPNCKRDIPAVNYTIHTVHCARNIKVCPVCKEPVPHTDLNDHHAKLHKLLPCKKCGESVCGTDLEDHIRDSCAHTIQSCRYCELELPRRELPAHEGYCGVRTEQCADCREWVMLKYRQLHEQSNHGFVRLHDDPEPKKEPPKKVIPKMSNIPKSINLPSASTSNGHSRPSTSHANNTNVEPTNLWKEMRYYNGSNNNGGDSSSSSSNASIAGDVRPAPVRSQVNGAHKAPAKRTNDQPQINKAVAAASKVNKDLPMSRGAVKKRPAPKPPARDPPAAEPKRDLAYYSAQQRLQQEERQRREQSAHNLSVGLPPVLSAAAKLEKLRKMDALHHRETEDTDYRSRLQGRVWMPTDVDILSGHVLGSGSLNEEHDEDPEEQRRTNNSPQQPRTYSLPHEAAARHPRHPRDPRHPRHPRDQRHDLRDLKPMTPYEFMHRFNELQLRREDIGEPAARNDRRRGDRFSEIKSSLRELRRGLNEVTAPYNANNANAINMYRSGGRQALAERSSSPPPGEDGEVRLPCEFCARAVPACDLVQHQTGCRPDLTQYRRSASPPPPPRAATPPPREAPPPPPPAYDEPVIPCEFCTESLPIYLISEHQERCGRETNLLYPD